MTSSPTVLMVSLLKNLAEEPGIEVDVHNIIKSPLWPATLENSWSIGKHFP